MGNYDVFTRRAGAFFDRATLDEYYASEADKVLRPARTLRWAGYALQGYSLYRRAQRLMPRPPLR